MSKLEVDAIEPQSGTTLTIGASGDTITIPSGATLSSTDPLVFPAGTVSLPSITTTGDTNTGIFFPAADTIGFAEGGAEAMRIDSSGNVGIGTSSPASKLTVSDANTAFVYVEENTGDIGDTAGILFKTSPSDGFFKSGIILEDDGTSYARGKLHIVQNSATDNTNATVSDSKITILNDGNVGIGTSSPTEVLHVVGDILATGGDFKSDANNYLGFSNDTFARFVINDSEKMRIDSSGSVGIGNTTMSSFNSEANNLVVGTGSGDEGITIYTGSSAGHHGSIFFADGTDVNAQKRGQIRYEHNNEIMSFFTNTLERLRIASNGRQTYNSLSTASGHGNFVGEVGASYNALAFEHTNGGGIIGTVRTTASSTAYNTSSDYRLKENVNYDFDATSRLKQLKPARFNFIADANTTVDGFLAHEVSSIVPEAISGEKDAVDENGNPEYQGIDQSKLVPLLVKTIQELEARITALETNQP
jgi:hypothetical protein